MIICIIAEGCYPYVTGGVSAWIHQLITGLPELEFKVLSIMPSHLETLNYCYEFPRNLLEVKTIYLDDYLKLKHGDSRKKIHFSGSEKEILLKLIYADPGIDWKEAVRLVARDRKIGSAVDFLQSDFFWAAVLKLYREKYDGESFNTFFWTIRTMMLPFITLLQQTPVDADVYHPVSTGYAGILGVCFHEFNQKPLVLTEHGIYAREREEEIIKAKWVTGIYKKMWIDFFYFITIAAYKEADKNVSLFRGNRDFQLELGAPRERTQIICNGVDLEKYSTEKETHTGYNIGAILRIVPIKDVMTLIRAFKIVRNTMENVKLYLVGPTDEEPEYYQQCRNLVELLKLNKDVIFTGKADVRIYLKKLDVMVLTSISEGQPLVILEGMASGIPVVSTDVGACRELLEADENEDTCGLITNLVSPNETAARIMHLLEKPGLREKMGQNGRHRVERAYSQSRLINSYKKIYEELR